MRGRNTYTPTPTPWASRSPTNPTTLPPGLSLMHHPPPQIKDGGAELDEDTPLGKHIVSRFPLHMQVRRCPAWICVYRVEDPSHPGTPTPIRCTCRCAAAPPGNASIV